MGIEESMAVVFTSVMGSGGLVGLGFWLLKKYIDAKMQKAEEEEKHRREMKARRMEIDDELHHCYGRLFFWINHHLTRGTPPNGELKDAFEHLQRAEAAKKQLDREILASQDMCE